jgi:hypothetical protein
MKLRYFATVVVLALTTVVAHAQIQNQIGLYINPIATNVSNSKLDTSTFAFLGPTSTSRTFWGVDLGGYDDFYHATNGITAGIDIRWDDLHANNASLKEFLIGVRVSGKPFSLPIKPYIQASVGEGATKAPHSIISVKKVDYRISGGLDYTLQRHIDFRVIEVGYGQLTTISSATVGGGGDVAIPQSNMLTFSSGLVFRF